MTSRCFQVDYLDYLDNVGVGSQALFLYPDVILLQCEAFYSQFTCSSCRQEKDSKDEVAKAEKELEEIHKVIEESGGKLSNRHLQCDVRLSLFSDFRSAHFFSAKQM